MQPSMEPLDGSGGGHTRARLHVHDDVEGSVATDVNQPLEVALSSQANPRTKSWEPLQAERTWYWLPMNPRRVYVWFRDANGNERGPFVAGPQLWRTYLPRIDR